MTRPGRFLVEYRDVLDALVLPPAWTRRRWSRPEVLEIFASVQKAAGPRLVHRVRQAAALGPARRFLSPKELALAAADGRYGQRQRQHGAARPTASRSASTQGSRTSPRTTCRETPIDARKPEAAAAGDQASGGFDLPAHRARRSGRNPARDRRGTRSADGLRDTPGAGSRGPTPSSSPGCGRARRTCSPPSFDADHDEMVIVRRHRAVRDVRTSPGPVHRRSPHIGYIPNVKGQITGLSKLARPGRRVRQGARRCRSG